MHLQNLRTECKLIAFVVMWDHFHLLVNARDGDIQKWTGKLKSLSARDISKNSPDSLFEKPDGKKQIWQESFKSLPLWSGWMIKQKINYIHANPIRAGLVKETREHKWSSFHSFYAQDTDPLLAVDTDWWWPDDVQKAKAALISKAGRK